MQYFGGKLSVAQQQVAGWVGNVRRSLQGALEMVWGTAGEKKEEDEEAKEEEDEGGDDGRGRYQRGMSPFRSFARRSRRSLRRLSLRGRHSLQRRATDSCSAQVNSYVSAEEDKDTDALIDTEPEQPEPEQPEACEEPSDTNSPWLATEEVPEVAPEDTDTTDFQIVEEPAPFPESSAPLLDTSLQRSKADLSKRRSRSRPSRVFRKGLSTKESPDWRTRDSTDEKEVKQKDSDSEEEKPREKPPTSQKVPVFPGLSPSALLAQLKRRTGGGGTGAGAEETEEDKGKEERESQKEEDAAPSPSLLSRSPRTASQLAGAARVLPPLGGTDKGGGASPAWLKELKSKKRVSQHDGEA